MNTPAREGVVNMINIPWLRAVLMNKAVWSAWIQQCGVPGYSPYPWYIGNIPQTPEVPYCYYKLVTNVIRAVKIHFCHTHGIRSDIPQLSANQHSGLKPPSL